MKKIQIDIYETAEQIRAVLNNKENRSIDFISNGHGQVTINTSTQDFTYTDRFGNDVLSIILKTKCVNNFQQKIACLASVMVAYKETGGFVFLETLK